MYKSFITCLIFFFSFQIHAQKSDYLIMKDGTKKEVRLKKIKERKIVVREDGKKVEYRADSRLVKEVYSAAKKQRILCMPVSVGPSSDFPYSKVGYLPNMRFLVVKVDGRIKICKTSRQDEQNNPTWTLYISKDDSEAAVIPPRQHIGSSFVDKGNRHFFREYLKDCPKVLEKFDGQSAMSYKKLCAILEIYNTDCATPNP